MRLLRDFPWLASVLLSSLQRFDTVSCVTGRAAIPFIARGSLLEQVEEENWPASRGSPEKWLLKWMNVVR